MKKIIKDFSIFSIGSILSIVIRFISTPIITHNFTPNQLGKYSAFDLVCSILYIVSMFGMVKGFERFFYDRYKDNRCKLLIICSKYNFIIVILLGILISIFRKPIIYFITGSVNTDNYVIIIFIVMVVILNIIREYCRSYVVLMKQNKLYSIICFAEKAIYLVVLLLVLSYTDKFVALIVSNIIMLSILIIIVLVYNRIYIKRYLSCIKLFHSNDFEIIKYSYPFMLSLSINLIYSYVDKFCIKYYCGFNQLGLYTAAFRVTVVFNLTHTLINKFMNPIIYKKYSANKDVRMDLENTYSIMGYAMLMTAICVIAFKDIFVILLSEDYIESINIMPFLIFMPMMMGMGELVSQAINLMKKTRIHIWISLITVIFNIITNIIFIPLHGIYAAAITTALTWILNYYIIYMYSQRKLKVNYSNTSFTIGVIIVFTVSLIQNMMKTEDVRLICLLSMVLITLIFNKDILKSINYMKKKR